MYVKAVSMKANRSSASQGSSTGSVIQQNPLKQSTKSDSFQKSVSFGQISVGKLRELRNMYGSSHFLDEAIEYSGRSDWEAEYLSEHSNVLLVFNKDNIKSIKKIIEKEFNNQKVKDTEVYKDWKHGEEVWEKFRGSHNMSEANDTTVHTYDIYTPNGSAY